MQKYKSLTRTTMNQTDNLPNSGLYVIAYMGRILYVGKAQQVTQRLEQHLANFQFEILGWWLRLVQGDWCNVRLDVLETPDDAPEYWEREAEAKLIRRFKPLFNETLNIS